MKKLLVGCVVLSFAIMVAGSFLAGCGSSSATAPVTVTSSPLTVTQQPTPYTGANYGYNCNGIDNALSSVTIYAEAVTVLGTCKTYSLSLHVGSAGTGNVELFVFNDSAHSPNNLMDYGILSSPVPNQWNTVPLNAVSLSSGVYWIGLHAVNNNLHVNNSTTTLDFFDISAPAYNNPPISPMPAGGSVFR